MELDDISKRKTNRGNQDIEAGSPTEKDASNEAEGDEEGKEGGDDDDKKEVVVLRLGEGKLTGPWRFITCYATCVTFLVMIGIIVWLLMISPPFNVTPQLLPEEMEAHIPPHLKVSTSTTSTSLPPDTEEPEFSSDFNQA